MQDSRSLLKPTGAFEEGFGVVSVGCCVFWKVLGPVGLNTGLEPLIKTHRRRRRRRHQLHPCNDDCEAGIKDGQPSVTKKSQRGGSRPVYTCEWSDLN